MCCCCCFFSMFHIFIIIPIHSCFISSFARTHHRRVVVRTVSDKASGFVWKWKLDNGDWEEYQETQEIEKAFSSNKSMNVVVCFFSFFFFFPIFPSSHMQASLY
jgi:hypothetical protein